MERPGDLRWARHWGSGLEERGVVEGSEESLRLSGLSRAGLSACLHSLRKPGPSVPVMALRLGAQALFVLRTDLYLNCSLRCRGGWEGGPRWRGGGRPRAGLELTGPEPR